MGVGVATRQARVEAVTATLVAEDVIVDEGTYMACLSLQACTSARQTA